MCTNFKGEPKLIFSVVISFGSFYQENPICRVYLLRYRSTVPFLCTALQMKAFGERVESTNDKGCRENKRQNSTRKARQRKANPSYFL